MSRPSWIGYTLGGRYKIEALLGQGGMSAVYRAQDSNLRRTVAVKLIHAHLSHDPEFLRRFEAEASGIAQWRHPNIVQVFDFNHDEDTYYMVMEFLPGESLQQRLKTLSETRQVFPLLSTANIIGTVAEAVAYAHERGTVHRDLKPANVMMMPRDVPVLTDFGVAKILGGQAHTVTGAIIGTPAYMSPEQVRGEALDGRADIYSLGIVLYEMAAGRPPFEGDSAMTVMMKHVNEPVPDIRTRVEVPAALKHVLDRALAKNAAFRYQTAAEMAADLRALSGRLQGQPAATGMNPTPVGATVIEPAAGRRAEVPTEPMPPAQPPVGATVRENFPAGFGAAGQPTGASQPPRPTGYNQAPAGYTQAPPPVYNQPPPPVYNQGAATGMGQTPAAVPQQAPPPERRSPNMLMIGGIIAAVVLCGVVALALGAWLGGPALLAMLSGTTPTTVANVTEPVATEATNTQAPTNEAGETATSEIEPPATDEVPTEVVPTDAVPATDTPQPPPPTDTPEPTDLPIPTDMVIIPAGSFQMGSGNGDAGPAHTVSLSAFIMDQFEVTNADYRACEAAGSCSAPGRRGSDTRGGYYTDPNFDNYPMLNVTWDQATAFCAFENKRLPTEAEWEYAATGGDGRAYPWGNEFDRNLVPVNAGDTAEVGSFPGGASPFGVMDMAGNALEWVSDWYDAGYYAVAPPENPTGPASGSRKVLRGGSFGNPDGTVYLTTRRFNRAPNGADVDIGFRCVAGVPGQ
jgi:formylglycine-generating enzyme required for sulfatase activity